MASIPEGTGVFDPGPVAVCLRVPLILWRCSLACGVPFHLTFQSCNITSSDPNFTPSPAFLITLSIFQCTRAFAAAQLGLIGYLGS